MDAVAAADGDRVLVLEGAALQRGEQRVDVGEQEVGGAGELHGRQVSSTSDEVMPWWTKRASAPTMLGQMGEEGDDVVLGHALDLVDAGDVERAASPAVPDRLRAASFGITPSSASASQACASISNQMRKRVSGDQMATISGRE